MLQYQATASKAEDYNEKKVKETKDQEVDGTKDQFTSEEPPKKKSPGFFPMRTFHSSKASSQRNNAQPQFNKLDKQPEHHGPKIPSGHPADISKQSNDSAPAQDTNLDATPKDHSQEQTDGAIPAQDINLDEAPDIYMTDTMMRVNAYTYTTLFGPLHLPSEIRPQLFNTDISSYQAPTSAIEVEHTTIISL